MKQDEIFNKLSDLENLIKGNEEPLALEQAAKYLGLSRSYLYKLTFLNSITFYKPNGKKIYFKKSDLNNWLYRNLNKSNNDLNIEAANYPERKDC